jgi:hypothetical protein
VTRQTYSHLQRNGICGHNSSSVVAFALRREGKKHGRWIDIGTARLESNGVIHAFLDRLPIGGFNGYVHFAPIGTQPPEPEPNPKRPLAGYSADDETTE